jgi:hypothetical protein
VSVLDVQIVVILTSNRVAHLTGHTLKRPMLMSVQTTYAILAISILDPNLIILGLTNVVVDDGYRRPIIALLTGLLPQR